tara:strand:- start:476 stop:706 length:231 start_codon:yes stop_codon:yes gene_type:complete
VFLKIWNLFQGDKKMNSETKLLKEVSSQKDKITRISGRVVELADQVHELETEVESFKNDVTQDLKRMVKLLENKIL